MAHKVRYNGCADDGYFIPKDLVKGREYEVVRANDRGWQTDYTLKGIQGEFNSMWFTEVTPKDKIYMALAMEMPEIGEQYVCDKIELVNGHTQLIPTYTSVVKEIEYMGNNIYQVTTCNSVYIVKLN